jgi:hypothetical protein
MDANQGHDGQLARQRVREDARRYVEAAREFLYADPEAAELDVVPGEHVVIDGVDLAETTRVLGRAARHLQVRERKGTAPVARTLSEIVAVADQLSSALQAVSMRASVALDDAIRAEDEAAELPERQVGLRSAGEISRASRVPPTTARRRLAASRRLVEDMPQTFGALADGTITVEAARTVGRRVGVLDPRLREQADRAIHEHLPALVSRDATTWNREMTGLITRLDADGAAERHREAVTNRNVTIRPTDDGMGRVTALLPGLDAAAIRKKLSLSAEAAVVSGDPRTHGQIMADHFADLVLERREGIDPVGLDVCVVVTDRTLLSPAHEDPAVIEGMGPLPAAPIRQRIRKGVPAGPGTFGPASSGPAFDRESDWADGEDDQDPILTDDARILLRRVLTDPEDGQLVGLESRARSFPAGMARMIRLRDAGTCPSPYCNAPIRHHDHIEPWADGGRTTVDNGNGLCAYCNLVKELLGSAVRTTAPDQPHTVRWTTRAGRTDEVTPTALIPGLPPGNSPPDIPDISDAPDPPDIPADAFPDIWPEDLGLPPVPGPDPGDPNFWDQDRFDAWFARIVAEDPCPDGPPSDLVDQWLVETDA